LSARINRLFSSPAAKKRKEARLKAIGNKRVRKLKKIEKKHRSTFNKLLSCPSCHKSAGSNSMCVTCQIRQGNKNRRKNPFNIS